jgi:hypothetical protein
MWYTVYLHVFAGDDLTSQICMRRGGSRRGAARAAAPVAPPITPINTYFIYFKIVVVIVLMN